MTTLLTLIALTALELTPTPHDVVAEKGSFLLSPGVQVVLAGPATPSEELALAPVFEAIGYPLDIARAADHDDTDDAIFVGVPGAHAAFDRRRLRKLTKDMEELAPGGYRVCIERRTVAVIGVDAAGVSNGLRTLAQIARQHPLQWPCMTIEDWPDTPLRGVVAQARLSRGQLAELAALKCNLVIFDSSDFLDLEGRRAADWKETFAACRALHMEPVPLVDPLADGSALLREAPTAAEGRMVEERVVLAGEAWAPLQRTNLVHSATSPINVTVSQLPCEEAIDYLIEPGAMAAPYRSNTAPWHIRRTVEGVIPDGATVTLRYTYIPEDSRAVCPSAPETRKALGEALARLVAELHPRYIHVGHGQPARLHQDARCRARCESTEIAFAASLHLLDSLVKEQDRRIRLMAWDQAFFPAEPIAPLQADPGETPKDLIVLVQRTGRKLPRDTIRLAGATRAAAYADARATRDASCLGVVSVLSDPRESALRVAMQVAWDRGQPRLAWPLALNTFFGAELWEPAHAERLAALIQYFNRQATAGATLSGIRRAFEEERDRLRDVLDEDDPELRAATAQFETLAEYLALEQAYAQDARPGLLRDLVPLVERQATLDPTLDAGRMERITATIERERLFVPGSILFGDQLLYYREGQPGGLYELPADWQFADTPGRVQAVTDLGVPVAPVARIDLEAPGAGLLRLEESSSGDTFTPLGEWRARPGQASPAPLFPRPASPTRYLRLTAEASGDRAILREVRLFAPAPEPLARCAYARATPPSDAGFSAVPWPSRPQVMGFLRDDGQYAQAPTTGFFTRTRDALYVGLVMHEPRPAATVAGLRSHDAPLWEEESVEVLLRLEGGPVYRLAVNPLGTRFDSEDGDPGWDGNWTARAETTATGWRVLMVLPHAMLGKSIRMGEQWEATIQRNRSNVRNEVSRWPGAGAGILRFE